MWISAKRDARRGSRLCFARIFLCSGLLFASFASPGSGQNVTFETYPTAAQINIGSGTPNGYSPLGPAGQMINLSDLYHQSIIKIVVTADGRKPWIQTFTSGELQSGTYSERIYLHPNNPLMYLVDFPLAFPRVFAVVLVVLMVGGIYYYREESAKKRKQIREDALLALGKEYEVDYGDYIAIKTIGQGGMGTVELGVRKDRLTPDGLVAIKTIFTDSSEEAESKTGPGDEAKETAITRLRREAKALRDSNHSNILCLYDWGERDNKHYIVMELLEGTDLQKYLEEKSFLTPAEVTHIFSQIASALDYLHQKKIFHRDIKPANIHRSPSGHIKLIDFGLAKSADQTRQLTKKGALMGTLQYMAPEHLQGKEQDAFYDQFAVGVVLFELLTGRKPVDKLQATLQDYCSPRPPIRDFCPDLKPEQAAVIDKMLSLEPQERFESIKAAFEAFEQANASEAKEDS